MNLRMSTWPDLARRALRRLGASPAATLVAVISLGLGIVTQFATLNNEVHRSLRVDGRPSAAYGDNQRFAQVIVGEFAHLLVHYPILFSKDGATGRFC